MQAHKETGQAVGAEALAGLAGFAPPTLHSLGARVASGLSKRWFNLVVTNVPGPQHPLYAGEARMLAAYPVVPLAKGQAVSIGLTSYDGGVYYGLNADRDAMPDVDVLAQCIEDALAELRGDGAMTTADHASPTSARPGADSCSAPGECSARPGRSARSARWPRSRGSTRTPRTSSSAPRPGRCSPRCSAPG